MCLLLYKLYRMERYKDLVMLATLALYGVLEQFVMNGFMNPFILLGAALLYPGILAEHPAAKEEESRCRALKA